MRRAPHAAAVLWILLLETLLPMTQATARVSLSIPQAWTVRDADDTKGPLDILKVTTGWRPGRHGPVDFFEVTTQGTWNDRTLGLHNKDGIAIYLKVPAQPAILIDPLRIRGRLRAPVFNRY